MSLPIKEISKDYSDGMSFYELAEKYNTYPNKIRRLLKKHNIPLRDRSEAQALALERNRKEHPTAGKQRPQDEKIRISQGMHKFWDQISPEDYQKAVERGRQNWDNITDEQKLEMSARAAEANRRAAKEGSSIEKYLLGVLIEAGYVVNYHQKNVLSTNLELDFYLPELKVAIEIDGPSHFKPIWGQEALERQIKYDTEKSGILLAHGAVLIRVKYLLSRFTLAAKQQLKTEVLAKLQEIEKSFPPKTKRLIEIGIGK